MWDLHELSFNYQFWFLLAFALGGLQLLTDEFFFGGACIGALITALLFFSLQVDPTRITINPSIPYIVCGVGGLIAATLMRRASRNCQEPPDINEEPYRGDDR